MEPPTRSVLRSAAETVVTASGLPALARRGRRGTIVLAYHNVIADGAAPLGDRSLHLPLAAFLAQVDRLRTTHDVVSLDDLASPAGGVGPRAAITFDDAYAGAVRLAIPALAARRLPATIFVAPGLLGRAAMWWDRLADPTHGLAPGVRDHVLGALCGDDAAALAWARESGVPMHDPGPDARIATEAELLEALALPGISAGCHTWSHPNLAALGPDAISAELSRSRDWLARAVPTARPWLAYPYGLHSPAVEAAAAAAGFTRAFRISGGWVPPNVADPMTLARLNVPAGMSSRGLALRTSGLIGT